MRLIGRSFSSWWSRMATVVPFLLTLLVALPLRAENVPAEVKSSLATPEPLGQTTYRWLGVPLYEATLYTARGKSFGWDAPLALQLVYARNLKGGSLVDATLAELDRIEGKRADHSDIRAKLSPCFRDVGVGDRYVAVAGSSDRIAFWRNGSKTCEFSHAGAKKRILGIWLSDDSRSVRQARRLRGL